MAINSISNLTDSTVAGSNTQIQYNNSGVFGASSNLTFNGTDELQLTDNTKLTLGTGNDADIYYDGTNLVIEPQVVGSGAVVINDAANVFLNETANANSTVGLTINQGANDDEIFALKSSDVAHGVTTLAETDTYTFFDKANSSGGLGATCIAGASTYSFLLQSIASAADTTKTNISGGSIMLHAGLINGTGIQKMSANGNLCAIGHSSDGKAAFLVDVEGDFYYDGVDGGAFDTYADAELARAFTHAVSDPAQVVRSRWDDEVRYNEEDLVKAKLIGYVSPEDKAKGVRPLVNGAQLQRLHHGAIWQLHEQLRNQEEEIKALRGELMRLQEKN